MNVPFDLEYAIQRTLRKPDCGHSHMSWPESDVKAILATIEREGYSIVPTSTLQEATRVQE